jgi:ABC-type arginine/histidine transport system permease subunit
MTIVGLKADSVHIIMPFKGCASEHEYSVKCICIIIITELSFLELLNYKSASSTTSATSNVPCYLMHSTPRLIQPFIIASGR